MKFTEEEISLCEQIAERHGKEIKYGDWYYYTITKDCFVNAPRGTYLSEDEIERKNIIPLWTISDCLEFLRKKVNEIELWQSRRKPLWFLRVRDYMKAKRWWKGNTPLEACLKAVLAVLEEQK